MNSFEIETVKFTDSPSIKSFLRRNKNEMLMRAEKSSEEILEQVKKYGDERVLFYVKTFDRLECKAEDLLVSQEEYSEAETKVSKELAEAISTAIANISKFHQAQKSADIEVETMPGVVCRQKSVAIEKVGLYIPGGTAPLFSSVIMLAVPARIAGCREIIMCTPVNREGKIAPEVLYCAKLCGVDKVYKIGGAAAIAAMAYGTETVERVDKIFGPGNSYVTAAKQLVSKDCCAIDMPAGPSEVMILADSSANAEFVCADFISQLEHGPESQAVLATTDEILAREVSRLFCEQVNELSRKGFVLESARNSKIILASDSSELALIANEYAPEHLIISTSDCTELAEKICNAGSIFLGNYTPESAGDYASGTNHTLPTGGWAVSYSGVNLNSFVKRITIQSITREGLANLAPAIERMAEAEGLDGHKKAVEIRLK